MTNKQLDRVTEAYKGNMGEEFAKKTRNRTNWIVNHVKGNRILDIGCSQGIIPIILGREGKIVDALDIAQESIEYAKNDLLNEHESVQRNVQFRASNFMTEDQLENEYETILLTEVLEHISDPESFLNKINQHLSVQGRLIVTVPFGINDYFDHKRTYYFIELYDQLSSFFLVEKIEYLGKWTGVICKKPNDKTLLSKENLINRESINQLEKAFLVVERELLTRVENFQMTLKEKNEYIKKMQQQCNQYIEKEKNQIIHFGNQITNLTDRLNEEVIINRDILQGIKEQNTQINSVVNFIEDKQDLTRKIEQLLKENDTLKGTLNKKDVELVELKEEKNNLLVEYENKIADKNQKINSLTEKIGDLRNKNNKENFTAQYIPKDKIINKLTDQVNELQIELQNSLINEEKSLIQAVELISKNQENENLIKELKEKSLNSEKQHDLEKQKRVELEKQYDLEKQKRIELEKQYDLEKQKRIELEKQHNLEKQKRVKLEKQNNLEKQKLVKLEKQHDLEKQKRVELEKQYNLEKQILAKLEKQYISEKENSKQLINTLQGKLESLESKYNTDNKRHQELINELTQKLNITEEKYKALKESKLGSITLNYWELRNKYAKKQ